MRPSLLGLVALIGLTVGCTHAQLRRNTVNQARTLTDLHQQQVLNNLAMFVANPDALPHFAYPNEGLTQVTDTGTVSPTLKWAAAGWDGAELGMEASRQANEVWNLHPINDPHKLALMRCAYQLALQSSGMAKPSECCPDCFKRITDFYKGHSHEGEDKDGQAGLKCLSFAPNWFCVGTKRDVPKDCCDLVGHYCGVYVWVPPAGRGELTKLSLAILDFALFDPEEPPVRTKEVSLYLDAGGKPAKPSEASRVVKADVPIDATNEEVQQALLGIPLPKEYRPEYRLPLSPQMRYLDRRQPDAGRFRGGLLQLQAELRAIDPSRR